MTPQQEAFCRAYIETGSASEAYRIAGYSTKQSAKSLHENASKLLAKVMPRIEQLQLAGRKRHDITVDKLTEMAAAAYDLAMQPAVAAPAAAISAVLAIGKLHGLVVDKKEVTRKRDATDLSESELLAIAAMGGAGAAAQALREIESDRVH
jgi:hypothetical protein